MTGPTAIIAEDELPQRQELRALLAELWPELTVVAECEDGLTALEALERHRPQVALLDIRMPGVSGLEVARAAGTQCHVIFISAYEEYALHAFDEGAVDYLLKPVARERLSLAIDRARSRLLSGSHVDMTALIDMVQARLGEGSKQGIKWITASVGNAVKMFSIDEVLFFQAQDKYTRVVTVDSEGNIRTPLKELTGALDSETFWQVHRSVIVRVGAIRAVEKGEDGKLQLTVRGRTDVLPVSSTFQHRFRGM
ncbi:MAG TPA: LytTR family DNA-binding domain-containing protein [Steroidobacteraceae bacterium]|jgi:Response regulator of the LytR/AlgR family|nr:LytTR family DNA-binding domain-containing protein [Steroidobacteraceae bacterium]